MAQLHAAELQVIVMTEYTGRVETIGQKLVCLAGCELASTDFCSMTQATTFALVSQRTRRLADQLRLRQDDDKKYDREFYNAKKKNFGKSELKM